MENIQMVLGEENWLQKIDLALFESPAIRLLTNEYNNFL